MAKKIWVLQRWIDRNGMDKTYNEMLDMVTFCKENGADAKVTASFQDSADRYKEKMEQNPDGYWLGYVGRSNYRGFCRDAKESLRGFIKERKESAENFRVVEATTEDDAKTWTGYTVVKVNDGVLKYLLATM